MNLIELLVERARKRPDDRALIDLTRSRGQTLTYADLDRLSSRAAAALRKHGLAPGDPVLLLLPMSADLYIALLAVLRAGLTAMFVDPSAGTDKLNAGCRLNPPAAFIGIPKAHLLRLVSGELRAIPKKLTLRGLLRRSHAGWSDAARRPFDPALLTFTTGSTGQAKAALRTHGFLLSQFEALRDNISLIPNEVDLATLPIFVLANLAAGVTSIIPAIDLRRPGRADPSILAANMEARAVTRIAASPALLERLADFCLANHRRLPGLRKIFTGGAPVFPRVLEKLQGIAPTARITAVYGSTEAEPIAHFEWNRITPDDRSRMSAGKGLLAGTPVREIEARVIASHWGHPIAPLPPGEFALLAAPPGHPGEIVVSGAHVLTGYLDGHGDEETKIQVDDTTWHRTGDTGYFDRDGRLWLLGRCGSEITDRHGTIHPFAVECAASHFIAVHRSALLEVDGNRVLALEAAPRLPLPLDELRQTLAWARIDRFRTLGKIPVDPRHNAKIDYPALRKLLGQQ